MSRIYLSPPYMCGDEIKYVQEAFAQNWIAPLGPNVTAFENEMAAYVGKKQAVATNSGTAAIHLALRWLGVGRGDTVFCSDFTFMGSCVPILYQDAQPIFIDSEPASRNMSPAALEDALTWAKKNGKLPKVVIIVDLYGYPADYDALLPLCEKYGVSVLEDAAEAIGAEYEGRRCGAFGRMGIASFNGNKIINTSGGGMVFTEEPAAAEKMLFWATQAREKALHYEHKEYGYNYRLSNVCAGIGRGQLEGLPHKIQRRREIYENYCELFKDTDIHMLSNPTKGTPNWWLSVAAVERGAVTPAMICEALEKENIESRPAWKPMHMQPVFKDCMYFPHEGNDVGARVFDTGVCLPSGEALSLDEQEKIARIIRGG